MPASNEIKDIIRDFVSFDVEKNYYQKEDKEELVRLFKKILFEDDVTVRKFLKSFFDSTKKLANEYSLVANEGDATEEKLESDEENSSENDKEENIPNEEIQKKESINIYRSIASNLLYE